MNASNDPTTNEVREQLMGQSRGRFGKLSPERVADIVLRAAHGADFAVIKAAFDALARRHAFARRDDLHVAPRGKTSLFGDYATVGTKGKKAGGRPYVTRLSGLSPLVMSCSCPDFVRSGLGVCKHGLVVLESLESSGTLGGNGRVASAGSPPSSDLRWDPFVPISGSRDRLARLSLGTRQVSRSASELTALFVGTVPDAKHLEDPEKRRSFVRELTRAIEAGEVTAEPSLPTLLAEELESAELRSEALGSLAKGLATLRTLSRTLYPYQREGIARFLSSGRLLLGDDMGLGKTTQAIAACHALVETKRVSRVLLVVPAALRGQWKREWDATTNKVSLTIVEGSPSERARLYTGTKKGALVMGYEQLLRDLPEVQAFDPEMLVLDEAQRVKNWATKSAAYVKSLKSRFRLVLTGTPMENRFDELGSLMDLVDDVALEPKWRLAAEHTIAPDRTSGGVAGAGARGGAKDLVRLRERLSKVFVRRIRREVLTELPPRTDTRVPVEMTAEQRAEHDELALPIGQLVAQAGKRPLTPAQFMRLMSLLASQRMICNGLAQFRFEETWPRIESEKKPGPDVLAGLFAPKLAALRALVEQVVIDQKRKAVVFSQWRNMLRLGEWVVRDLLAEHGLRAAFFTGSETPKQRERAVADLASDPTLGVLFLSDAGGVGLNLQHAASVCVNLELPWNPAVLEQRIGRIYRLGQTQPIDVFNLVCEDGIESRIAGLLERKRAVFSALFDGTSDEVRFDGEASFLDGIRKLVDPVELPALEPAEGFTDTDEITAEATSDANARTNESAAEESTVVSSPPLGLGLEALVGLPGLRVEHLPDGGVRLEASKDLAPLLAKVFADLARALTV